MSVKVRMLKTLAPVEIPNGSVGEVVGKAGALTAVIFESDAVAYVYDDEIEEVVE